MGSRGPERISPRDLRSYLQYYVWYYKYPGAGEFEISIKLTEGGKVQGILP